MKLISGVKSRSMRSTDDRARRLVYCLTLSIIGILNRNFFI